ncbi:MAG: RNA-binding protein [Dehalococcoidia bacterium]
MNIYVGNLSLDVTEVELQQEFAAFGEVVFATIVNGKYLGSGQSRGYGFVEMPSISEGEAAITGLNGKLLGQRSISVIQALPLSHKIASVSSNEKRGGWVGGRVRQRKY